MNTILIEETTPPWLVLGVVFQRLVNIPPHFCNNYYSIIGPKFPFLFLTGVPIQNWEQNKYQYPCNDSEECACIQKNGRLPRMQGVGQQVGHCWFFPRVTMHVVVCINSQNLINFWHWMSFPWPPATCITEVTSYYRSGGTIVMRCWLCTIDNRLYCATVKCIVSVTDVIVAIQANAIIA